MAAFAWGVIFLVNWFSAGDECFKYYSLEHFNSDHLIDSLGPRSQSGEQFIAVLVQPKNLAKSEYTVVCYYRGRGSYFEEGNYYRFERYTGNKLQQLQKISDMLIMDD